MKKIFLIFVGLLITTGLMAQPGYIITTYQFTVFINGINATNMKQKEFIVLWKTRDTNWSNANIINGSFFTEKIKSNTVPLYLKIFVKNTRDTMFIETHASLDSIPFLAGSYKIDRSVMYLAKMEPMNGCKIINTGWEHYRTTSQTIKPFTKQRYYYHESFSENDDYYNEINKANGIIKLGFSKSEHIKNLGDDYYASVFELGKLYYNPLKSTSIFCIAYLNNVTNKNEELYDSYLLESKNNGLSWQKVFKLDDSYADLIDYRNGNFVFSGYVQSSTGLSVVNGGGKKMGEEVASAEDLCDNNKYGFAKCDDAVIQNTVTNNASKSNPIYASNSIHEFYTKYTNGNETVSLFGQIYNPEYIVKTIGDQTLKQLQLNTNESYVYLTARKNRLVLLSYHYTLVSNDFGNTWTFYSGASFEGGSWNFLWLNDNTLINITNEHIDYFYF